MEQQNPNNSVTSTARIDHNSPEKDARPYECTFCKRGFTNAQALGGHMNIHRKDKMIKSKGKLKNLEEINLTRFPQVDPSGHVCNPMFGGHVNYQVYFTSSNHCIQTRNYFPVWRPDCREDPIGPVEDGEVVDLELRLGQYP
ncbi:hypothetical protein ACS0TY_022862 [Phlomoides rotata]